MPKVARVGDKLSMNCPHGATGTIVSGSPNIEVNGKPIALQGCIVKCDVCGITRTIDSGSADTFGNVKQVARVGDPSTGICNPGYPCCPHTSTATITTGSGNTIDNGE